LLFGNLMKVRVPQVPLQE